MERLCALDVGNGETLCLLGEYDERGELYILAQSKRKTQGLNRGVISDIERLSSTLRECVLEVERMSGIKVDGVFVSLSNPKLKSENLKESVLISTTPKVIDEGDLNRLLEKINLRARDDEYEIIHKIPKSYTLDNQEGVKNPVGLMGTKLSAEVHIVKVPKVHLLNFKRAINNAGLEVLGVAFSGIANFYSLLKYEDVEDGLLLIDLGHSLTNFVLFLEGSPTLCGVVQLGGIDITKDVAHYLGTDLEEAEKIKKNYGSALVELTKNSEGTTLSGKRRKNVSLEELSNVIQVRVEEILEEIAKGIQEKGYDLDQVKGGVALTGGGSKLRGIRELCERFFNLPTFLPLPREVYGLSEELKNPEFSTAIGLLKMFKNFKNVRKEKPSKNGSFLKKLLNSIKRMWEEEL